MADRVVMPNNVMLGEVSRLLESGKNVILPVKGNSMLPFITGGRDSVELTGTLPVRRGDIVLARQAGDRYVLHRVICTEGDRVVLMGDGNLKTTELCGKDDVCGTVVRIIAADGKSRDCRNRSAMFRAGLWRVLLPVRRLLLALYRRTVYRLKISDKGK